MLSQKLLDVMVAEAKPKGEPDRMTDDLLRGAKAAGGARRHGWLHQPSIPEIRTNASSMPSEGISMFGLGGTHADRK